MLFDKLYPDECCESAYDIDYEAHYSKGYRGIIFDIDNTLVEHGYPADARSKRLLSELDSIGFKILFLSNNKESRVKSFRDEGAPFGDYIYKAGKPKRAGYFKAAEMMGIGIESTLFVGDQLFTDVWGARNAGIYSILVNPLDPHEEIQIIFKRVLERFVLIFYRMKLRREGRKVPNLKR